MQVQTVQTGAKPHHYEHVPAVSTSDGTTNSVFDVCAFVRVNIHLARRRQNCVAPERQSPLSNFTLWLRFATTLGTRSTISPYFFVDLAQDFVIVSGCLGNVAYSH